jgi:Carotenoid biosynthesis protein
VLTLWDVSMDPAMVKTNHWFWQIGDLSDRSAFEQWIGKPIFFGMPITNWLGWLLTGILVARVMLAIIPPSEWVSKVAPHRLPIALYAINGLLPVGHGAGRRAGNDCHGGAALGRAAQRSGPAHQSRHGPAGPGWGRRAQLSISIDLADGTRTAGRQPGRLQFVHCPIGVFRAHGTASVR